MRTILPSLLCVLLVVCASVLPKSAARTQFRSPDSLPGRADNFPQQKDRHLDIGQLKSDAQELVKMASAVSDQIGHLSNDQAPKELVENLKKVEKLSKHMRGEVSP